MALKDMTREDIKNLVIAGDGTINICKNNLKADLDTANAIPAAVINKYFDATEKTELVNKKNKWQAIYDAIIAQGF